jgi:hypothetical protein
MLAATTTERVVDRVHRHTTHTRPLRATSAHFVVLVSGLHERFLCPTAACDHADRGATIGRKPTDLVARELYHRSVAVVGEQCRAHTRCTGELTPVTGLALDVTHRYAFRDFPEWKRIARRDFGADSDLYLITNGNALWCEDESLVSVFEFDCRDRRRARRIVFDIDDRTADDIALFCRSVREISLIPVRGCAERRRPAATSLAENASSHD